MRRRSRREERDDPMGLFMDPIMDFIGLMFFFVIFLLIRVKPDVGDLRILAIEPPPVASGLPYAHTLAVQGGLGDRKFTALDEGLSNLGLSLDSASGLIHGVARIPAGPEIRSARVRVTDESDREATAELRFRMAPYAYPVTREDLTVKLLPEAAELPPARQGVPYEGIVGARGGLGRTRWSASGLPPDLRIADGRIVGVARTAGAFRFEVKAELVAGSATIGGREISWGGSSDAKQFELTVLPALAAPNRLPFARTNENWIASLFTSPLRFVETLEVHGLPEGVLPGEGGVLSGRPRVAGPHTVRFRVVTGKQEVAAGRTVLPVLGDPGAAQALELDVTGRVGEPVRAGIAYRGLLEPVSLGSAFALPEDLAWVGPVLSGSPKKPGLSRLPITLTDALGTRVSTTARVKILPALQQLKIDVPRELFVAVGKRFALPVRTVGGDAPALVEARGPLPPGCELTSGVLNGTLSTLGEWKVQLRATDPTTGATAAAELSLNASWPHADELRIATPKLPRAVVGEEYVHALSAVGGAGPVRWKAGGSLPEWLRLENGVLRGTPSSEQPARLIVAAEDALGRTTKPHTLELAVERPERSTPRVVTRSLPQARLGSTYAIELSASAGLGDYSWLPVDGLPASLELSKEGRLHGVPRARDLGRHALRVAVEDERGARSATQELTLEVIAPDTKLAPKILTHSLPAAVVGKHYDLTLASSGGAGVLTWTVSQLPPGLGHDAGRISGTPKEPGKWKVEVVCRDGAGAEATAFLDFESVLGETRAREAKSKSKPARAATFDRNGWLGMLRAKTTTRELVGLLIGIAAGVVLTTGVRRVLATRKARQKA